MPVSLDVCYPHTPMSDQKTSLGMIAVPNDILKRDIEVLDRYQAFSSELLRLSLLAIFRVPLALT